MVVKFGELPRSLRCYILAHLLVPVLCAWAMWGHLRFDWALGGLLLLGVCFSAWKLELPVFHGRLTLAFVAVCLALVSRGLSAAVLCAACTAFAGTFIKPIESGWRLHTLRPPSYRVLFNVGNCLLATLLGGWVFEVITSRLPHSEWIEVFALSAFTLIHFMVNSVGVAVAMGLQQSVPWRIVWSEKLAWTAPGFFAGAGLAVIVFAFLPRLGPRSLLFLPLAGMVFYWSRLYSDRIRIEEKERADRAHIQELNRLNDSVISALAMAIDAKDRYTCTHISRVRQYAVALAQAAGMSGPQMQAVATGALLYDIGKLGVPDNILCKPGALTPEEDLRCQEHVTIGAAILSQVDFPFPVVDVVLHHHECWDGCGYPNGVAGEAIPAGARIIAIADMYDALTSNRPYRRALSHHEALRTVCDHAGTAFDPDLVAMFVDVLPGVLREIEAEERGSHPAATAEKPQDGLEALHRISQAAIELSTVCDVAHALSEQQSSEEVVDLVVNRVLGLTPVDTAVIYLLSDDGALLANAVAGKHSDRLKGMKIAIGEGLVGRVAQEETARVNQIATADIERRFAAGERAETVMGAAIPLRGDGATIGVLAVYTESSRELKENEVRLLTILADHAAASIQNLRRLTVDRELAYTDAMTGLSNGRRLVRDLEQMTAAPERPFTLVMMDLNRFKEVNDTFGHLTGDEVLRIVGRTLRSLARPGDLVCRYAGDEFVILAPGLTEEGVRQFIARVRAAIAALPPVEGKVQIGSSIGAACFPVESRDARALLHLADQRMYQDKTEMKARQAAGRLQLQEAGEPALV